MSEIQRSFRMRAHPVDYGDFIPEGASLQDFRNRVRNRARIAAEYGNLILSAYFAYRAKILTPEQWAEHRKRLNEKYKKYLPDAVRAHYYHSEVAKVSRQITRILRGEMSLPTLRSRSTLPVRDRGVKLWRDEEKKTVLVQLTLVPSTPENPNPKQPVFALRLGGAYEDNHRQSQKRRSGQLLWANQVVRLLDGILSGEIPCTGAKLRVEKEGFFISLSVRYPVRSLPTDDRLWGCLYIAADGEIVGIPRVVAGVEESVGQTLILTRSFFHVQPEIWEHLKGTWVAFQKRILWIQSARSSVGADQRSLRDLVRKRRRWQKHWINVLANMVVEWAAKNKLPLVVVYETAPRRGNISRAPFPPHLLVQRIVEVCERLGIPCQAHRSGSDEALCLTCGKPMFIKGGTLLCRCRRTQRGK